jgi:membrane-associated protease RseP (regulator of RpoE activity)
MLGWFEGELSDAAAMRPLPVLLAIALVALSACEGEQPDPVAATAVAEPAPLPIDPALLADLLGEAVTVEDNHTLADGLLIRLAFEPLIRQTGPGSLQLVQSTGYRLLGVTQGAPLWQLGFREGDILTSVDGQPIIGREHELRSQWERRPASTEIGYQRDGQARIVSLRIQSGTAWRGSEPIQPSPDLKDPFARTDVDVEPAPVPVPADGVRCVPGQTADSLGSCEIQLAAILALLEDPSTIAKQARIVPATRDGVTRGFKLYGIRASSLPSQLGIQNGDLIVAVDGQTLDGMDAALTAFTKLPQLGTFTLTIERRGESKQLTIKIVDALTKD